MADPVSLDASALHPCQYCAGKRTLHMYPWRDPAFWAACTGCDNAVAGDTESDAVTGWNAANPLRQVTPEEVLEVEAARLQPLLTEPFLETLASAYALYHDSEQPPEAHHFVAWLRGLAGKEHA